MQDLKTISWTSLWELMKPICHLTESYIVHCVGHCVHLSISITRIPNQKTFFDVRNTTPLAIIYTVIHTHLHQYYFLSYLLYIILYLILFSLHFNYLLLSFFKSTGKKKRISTFYVHRNRKSNSFHCQTPKLIQILTIYSTEIKNHWLIT